MPAIIGLTEAILEVGDRFDVHTGLIRRHISSIKVNDGVYPITVNGVYRGFMHESVMIPVDPPLFDYSSCDTWFDLLTGLRYDTQCTITCVKVLMSEYPIYSFGNYVGFVIEHKFIPKDLSVATGAVVQLTNAHGKDVAYVMAEYVYEARY